MMIYFCTKFHENILNGIRVNEWTRKVNGRTDGQTDGRTDGGHDIIPPVFDGRIKRGLELTLPLKRQAKVKITAFLPLKIFHSP